MKTWREVWADTRRRSAAAEGDAAKARHERTDPSLAFHLQLLADRRLHPAREQVIADLAAGMRIGYMERDIAMRLRTAVQNLERSDPHLLSDWANEARP